MMTARRTRFVYLAAATAAIVAVSACSAAQTDAGSDTSGTGAAGSAVASPAASCDIGVNTVAFYDEAGLAGTLHDDSMAGMEEMDHGSGAHPGDGTSMVPMDMSGGMGEVEAARMIDRLNQMPTEDYEQWLASLDPARDVEAPDDTGQGGHLGPQTWTPISDEGMCAELSGQLDVTRDVAMRYPKAADAQADGYVLVAPYLPGIASHWMKFANVDGTFDIAAPEMLLYDGNDGDANIVGVSYFIRSPGDSEPSDGFVGDNDHYHRHEGLCVSAAGVIGDSTTSAEDCEAIGGRKQSGASGWMSHAWVVPGCESPWGVFSAQNPVLDAALGQGSGQGAPCSASQAAARWDLSPATSGSG